MLEVPTDLQKALIYLTWYNVFFQDHKKIDVPSGFDNSIEKLKRDSWISCTIYLDLLASFLIILKKLNKLVYLDRMYLLRYQIIFSFIHHRENNEIYRETQHGNCDIRMKWKTCMFRDQFHYIVDGFSHGFARDCQ